MADTMRRAASACQPESPARSSAPRTTSVAQAEADVALLLVFIRNSMEELKWNDEALSVEMGYTDASYVGKVLKGEKPLSAAFLVALPDDLEARFAEKWAEHRGAVVVPPLSGRAAVEALVAGLVGVLAPQLPARADRMAHATPNSQSRKVAAR